MSRITITNERIQKNKMRRDILEVRGVVKGVANVGYKGGHCGKDVSKECQESLEDL